MNHSNQVAAKGNDLTEEQKQAIAEDFNYQEKCEITEAEVDILVDIFDTPEKLVLLRKLFLVVTEEERGVTVMTPTAGDTGADFEKFGLLTYAENLANEKVKDALGKAYNYISQRRKTKMAKTFKAQNVLEKKQADRTEATAEATEIADREVGPNL